MISRISNSKQSQLSQINLTPPNPILPLLSQGRKFRITLTTYFTSFSTSQSPKAASSFLNIALSLVVPSLPSPAFSSDQKQLSFCLPSLYRVWHIPLCSPHSMNSSWLRMDVHFSKRTFGSSASPCSLNHLILTVLVNVGRKSPSWRFFPNKTSWGTLALLFFSLLELRA